MRANPNDKLVRMANQIAAFFRSYPEDEATAGIAQHLRAYWTPKMLRSLAACTADPGSKLDALVVKAIVKPPEADSPVRTATHDPQLAGQGASDAG